MGKDIKSILESEILPLVTKPGRYVGGELGMAVKPDPDVDVRIALAFPDVYEIGMSHLGLKILYALVNEQPRLAAERVFAPWPDMEAMLRRHGAPLYGLETFRALNRFDLIGFSLQHELTYTNILTMLDLSGIAIHSRDREDRAFPLVVAGGPGAYNPAPLEDFIDLFIIGDGEEAIVELMAAVGDWKKAHADIEGEKKDLLRHLARSVRGIYVPELYRRVYAADGRLLSHEPCEAGVPRRVTRRAVPYLESARLLQKIPVPNVGVVHDRLALEVRRGCGQGCRFCQAGMIYRPVRDVSPQDIEDATRAGLKNTGYEEVALCALSIGDFPDLASIAERILKSDGAGSISLSLPSLRPDRLAGALAKRLAQGPKTGITLAPEAGTDALRRRINKKVSMDDLVGFVADLRGKGWRMVKLYFMIGLPGETEDDLKGIVESIRKVADAGKQGRGKWEVNVTISSFVPKPHTPFQWAPMENTEGLRSKQAFLRREVPRKKVYLKFHDLESSFLEGVFARGDRKLGRVIVRAWQAGCRFDGWRETFNYNLWREAFEKAGIDPRAYAEKRFADDEYMPWDVIDAGVRREFLLDEKKKAARGEFTPDCVTGGCQGCGLCVSLGVKPVINEKPLPACPAGESVQ
jgi:radical SAM family uncharacterized protein